MHPTSSPAIALAISLCLASTLPAAAQVEAEAEASANASILIELNGLEQVDASCRITFVATSTLDASIAQLSTELVIFNSSGLVSRMTTVDLRDVPSGRTRVRQFDFPDLSCGDLSRVLINDIVACDGDGLEPTICMSSLRTRSASPVDLGS